MKMKESTVNWCETDYKNNHCWEKIGIQTTGNYGEYSFIVWWCSQCGKCMRAPLELVKGSK